MPLVTTKEMFRKAYEGGYAIGAFNVNNMEIVQGITEAAQLEQAPVILQVSAGARKYAKHIYLTKLVEAAVCRTVERSDSEGVCRACRKTVYRMSNRCVVSSSQNFNPLASGISFNSITGRIRILSPL